jgi:ribosomal protein S18 acetylase RimI-like enzyme
VTEIRYKVNVELDIEDVCRLYDDSGLARPTGDLLRMTEMYVNSPLVVSAWAGEKLIGIARTLTDFAWASYLADLAVAKEFQEKGIGRELFEITKREIGSGSMLLLISVPEAQDFYTRMGLEKETFALISRRSS